MRFGSEHMLQYFLLLFCNMILIGNFLVEVLGPSQPYGIILSAVSLCNHIFTGQA